jgi:hypothetical protein
METLKNIVNAIYYIVLSFSLMLGGMMEYFGNSYGRFILIPTVIIGCYEMYKSDKE